MKRNQMETETKMATEKPARNWLELPPDVTANILHRIGAVDILENAQKVCTTWRTICQVPSMWRIIDMRKLEGVNDMPYDLEKMCKHAVDRSQGQLVDINIEYFGTPDLLHYIVDRSSQLRRLRIVGANGSLVQSLSKVVKTLPLLEELHLYHTEISKVAIEDAGYFCPMLKSFKLNTKWNTLFSLEQCDEEALAIAKSMPQLRHLQIVGNRITNKGLRAILDGCLQLESLDLRRCHNIELEGGLGKRCSEQVKYLRPPGDSIEDYGFIADEAYESDSDDCYFRGCCVFCFYSDFD